MSTEVTRQNHKVGTRGYIIRHRHGWENGNVEGVVIAVHGRTHIVRSDEGIEYELANPRDFSPKR